MKTFAKTNVARACRVKMYYFALVLGPAMGYSLAALRGKVCQLFEKLNQQAVLKPICDPLPALGTYATLRQFRGALLKYTPNWDALG
jgi:hypothetical protein